MLNENEIRIGNYFYNMGLQTQFDINDWDCIVNRTFSSNPMERYKPIPLTEEWLLKFGFVHSKTDKSNVYKLGSIFRFVYCFDGKFKGKDMLMFGNIQLDKKNHLYVHQLQNLCFALTGEELELC